MGQCYSVGLKIKVKHNSSETALLDGNQALIAWKKFLAGKNIIMILMLAMDGTQL